MSAALETPLVYIEGWAGSMWYIQKPINLPGSPSKNVGRWGLTWGSSEPGAATPSSRVPILAPGWSGCGNTVWTGHRGPKAKRRCHYDQRGHLPGPAWALTGAGAGIEACGAQLPRVLGETLPPAHLPHYPEMKNLSNQFPMLWPSPGPQLFTRLA